MTTPKQLQAQGYIPTVEALRRLGYSKRPSARSNVPRLMAELGLCPRLLPPTANGKARYFWESSEVDLAASRVRGDFRKKKMPLRNGNGNGNGHQPKARLAQPVQLPPQAEDTETASAGPGAPALAELAATLASAAADLSVAARAFLDAFGAGRGGA